MGLASGLTDRTLSSQQRRTGLEVDIPQLSGVHTRIGTCDSPASLSEIAFSIPEPTGNFCSFAGFTFCFWRRLQTLDFLETTIGKDLEKGGEIK